MKNSVMIVAFTAISGFAFGQQFVYKPLNPAFGGDTFNYNWLLSSASSQNQFKDSSSTVGRSNSSSLDSLTDSINRQLMSEISKKLFGDQFGDGDLKPGTYVFGDMYLEITQTDQGLLINILNTSTGEQSEIIIPN